MIGAATYHGSRKGIRKKEQAFAQTIVEWNVIIAQRIARSFIASLS